MRLGTSLSAKSPVLSTTGGSLGLTVQGFTPPQKLSDFKLIAFDMDSTLINIECVDEIATITEAAMQGEITDYKDSLRQRVALLRGVSVGHMEQVYSERLRLNSGAADLVAACKAAGLKALLLSGGFTFFTDHIRQRLDIDFVRSNVLEIENGLLTGRMVDRPGATSATAPKSATPCLK